MKLWTSGEVQGDVGDKTISNLKIIEKKVNDYLENKNYGEGVILWGYIGIVLPSGLLPPSFFQEVKRYSKSKKETEYRLKLDYDQLVKADEKERYFLICESILRSIEIARTELKIPNFDLSEFEKDLKECFKKEGWVK